MRALYNDNDPFVCRWLENLIGAGLIAPGDVDARPIQELTADDLAERDRVHLFAGIGGWDYALQLAGWAGPIWTASCPCQPFSSAGGRGAERDERHLWPELFRLVRDARPPILFGEQVASADGRAWLAGVRADLDSLGYRVGAADLCAAGVGAPHIRQRLYWVADAERGATKRQRQELATASSGVQGTAREQRLRLDARHGGSGVADADSEGQQEAGCWRPGGWRELAINGRRVPAEPTLQPVADGFSGSRVGTLRGSGNAIVPQVAAEFITAYMECQA